MAPWVTLKCPHGYRIGKPGETGVVRVTPQGRITYCTGCILAAMFRLDDAVARKSEEG